MASRKRRTDIPLDPVARLRAAGLRPTRQRRLLTKLLFRQGDRHVTAELLHQEAGKSDCHVSLATIYNTLHQFTAAGLLRQVVVDSERNYFDTNTTSHQHFYDEDAGQLIDIPGDGITVSGLPNPPAGMAVAQVDVVVRLRSSGKIEN
ncbi:MAG TPA: Fur family transcriptional regulator [Rhizomicrobium sp.]|jgi:Fur family iron response transcriptional regulator